jgi:hypothetical protein
MRPVLPMSKGNAFSPLPSVFVALFGTTTLGTTAQDFLIGMQQRAAQKLREHKFRRNNVFFMIAQAEDWISKDQSPIRDLGGWMSNSSKLPRADQST